ncbi:MAG: cation transporter [Chloroflexi bacterium]|nr:cation transporter [Chloroflexota bacterium]
MFSTKTSAAGLSILSNSLLVALKLAAGVIMGSVSVISEGVHSAVDLLAAIIAFFSIRAAAKPADEEHEFGHGKIENISGAVEALLIFGAAGYIIYESIDKIINRAQPEFLTAGIGIMAFSAVANFFVSRHLHRIAHRDDSIALEADAWHLTTDVYTSLGVLAGLIVVQITHWYILDPVIAICVALLILRAAWNITSKSVRGLIDVRLPSAEEDIITASIMEHVGELAGFHELRTRKSGSQRYIELHLVMPKKVTVEEAHVLCDHLEEDIKSKLPEGVVTIHCEPCDQHPDGTCPPDCPGITCRLKVEDGKNT